MKSILLVACFISIQLYAQNSLERLEKSPRHHEWVDIIYGNRTVKAFLVFPEVSEKVPVVVVIHENRGLNDWARSMADQLAEAGFIAIAPDLLSGAGPSGKGTAAFANSDDARTAIYALDPEQVTADLNATISYAERIKAGNKSVAVMGFCWGGSQTFRIATNNTDIKAALVCYGTGPAEEDIKRIKTPVYGFYGGNDNRVNATIDDSKAQMAKYDKSYEPIIYSGAGHGFFRAGEAEDASDDNINARKKGFDRAVKILSGLN